MINKGELGLPGQLEKEIFSKALCTARTYEDALQVFEFPVNPGTKILDIGGGGSSVTASLLDLGLDAYAVDPLYRSRSDVRAGVKKHTASFAARFRNSDRWEVWVEEAKKTQASLEKCMKSMKENPDHYKPAFATSLPFEDETFDMAFSLNCITEYLDYDPELLIIAVNEALRVVKRGGEVQLHPFRDKPLLYGKPNVLNAISSNEIRNSHQNTLIDYLRGAGIAFDEVLPEASRNNTLVILRPE